jgi:hypothetical protein
MALPGTGRPIYTCTYDARTLEPRERIPHIQAMNIPTAFVEKRCAIYTFPPHYFVYLILLFLDQKILTFYIKVGQNLNAQLRLQKVAG